MDLFMPIGLGCSGNLVVLSVSNMFKQSNARSVANCFLAFLTVLAASYFIGAGTGMGLMVISAGMLLFAVSAAIVLSLRKDQA